MATYDAILSEVKRGILPEVHAITLTATTSGGLRVYCGQGAYRNFPMTNGGNLYQVVALAIDAAMHSPYSGEFPSWERRITGYH